MAEDFLSVFRCSVECMHSNYPCSFGTFLNVAVTVPSLSSVSCDRHSVWTCLTVFFLGTCSKYYVVTSCICSCFVCYFDSRSAYFNVCDNWSVGVIADTTNGICH